MIVLRKNTITSLEISEISGKRHNDVLKAIRSMELAWINVTGGNFALSEYLDSTGRKLPMYELSKRECLYVATKFNDEARAKLIMRWEKLETLNLETKSNVPMSTLDILELTIRGIRENQTDLAEIKNDVRLLKAATKTTPDYFTIIGHATLHGIYIGLKQASNLGKKASAICKSKGFMMEEIPDPRFGKVNTYPKVVLEKVFNFNII